MALQINIGCGVSPTRGWRNYDNSWSVRLARHPWLAAFADKIGLISETQKDVISFARGSDISWADGARYIPEEDHTVDAVYSCHMLEHLDRYDATQFLGEVRRILKSGGVLRLAVPDIAHHVENYSRDGDADQFVENTGLTRMKPRTLIQKMKYLAVGDRNHQWMYDGKSLRKLLEEAGFDQVRVMDPGTTMIENSGELNLHERLPQSIFLEARNP